MTEESAYGNVFNVGATTEISIIDLARRIIELTESGSETSMIPYNEAYGEGFEDMYRRVPDITKVRDAIGWSPLRTLDDIVKDVIGHQRRAHVRSVPSIDVMAPAVGVRSA
jgi:UDP-glucose 4-epimerase